MIDPIDAIEKRLYDPSDQVRRFAADILVEIGTPRAIQALINGYLSPVDSAGLEDAFDSTICTYALKQVGTAAVRELLPFITQGRVIWLLGQLRSESAVDPMIAAYRSNSPETYAIVSGLGNIGSPRALSFLRQVSGDRTNDDTLRQWAKQSIQSIERNLSAPTDAAP